LYYSIFFAAWSISFLSSWTRRENEYKFLWGTEGHEEHEAPRSEFKGQYVVNEETGRESIVYTSQMRRYLKLALSFFISALCIYITGACALWATSLKYTHNKDIDGSGTGRNRYGVQGAHLNPLGLFLRTSTPFIWSIRNAFLLS
jgi:hypothetical protein